MAASANGWIANERDRVERQLVPGTTVWLTVRRDAPGLLLLEVAAAYDRLVEDIDNGRGGLNDWGYAERPIRGGSTLSNHASGTAVDLNATKHPLGVPAIETMTSEQIDRCHQLEHVTGGVVRWGGDWSRPDAMHWEIAPGQTLAGCELALSGMRDLNALAVPTPKGGRPPVLQRGSVGRRVRELQRVLNAWYPWLRLVEDGEYGPKTADAVRYLQSRTGLVVDGITGPATRAVLAL